jgi:hypothetical protein
MDGGEDRLRRYKSLDALLADLNLNPQSVPPLALKYMRLMMAADPKARCSIDRLMDDPAIFDLVVRFGLNNLLKADGPRVMVVSPSMEDFRSSAILPLTDESVYDKEVQTETPVQSPVRWPALMRVAMFLGLSAQRFTSRMGFVCHCVVSLALVGLATDDLQCFLLAMMMVVSEMSGGVVAFSFPILVLLGILCFMIWRNRT